MFIDLRNVMQKILSIIFLINFAYLPPSSLIKNVCGRPWQSQVVWSEYYSIVFLNLNFLSPVFRLLVVLF